MSGDEADEGAHRFAAALFVQAGVLPLLRGQSRQEAEIRGAEGFELVEDVFEPLL